MKRNKNYWHSIRLILVLPLVAAGIVACESDSNPGNWNRASGGGDTQANSEQPATGNTAPPPSTSTGGADAIDPGSIHYLHANVSNWPITTTLRASVGGSVNLNYDKANVWPANGQGLNANPWIIVNHNGRWTAATFEWLRKGQTSKPKAVVEGGHIKKPPLNNFRPVSGEMYGLMVSSLARDKQRTVNERSNIVMVRWP